MIVIPILLRRLESDVRISLCHNAAYCRVHFAERVGVEGDLARCIVDVGIIIINLGNVDISIGQEDVGIYAKSVIDAQGIINKLGDGGGSYTSNRVGSNLLKKNGQYLLIDPYFKSLGAIGVLGYGYPDILTSIPRLVGGGVGAGSRINGIGAVGIFLPH